MRKNTTVVWVVLLVVATGVVLAATSSSLSDGDPEWNNTSVQSDMSLSGGDYVLETKSDYQQLNRDQGEFVKGYYDGPPGAYFLEISPDSEGDFLFISDQTWGPTVETSSTVSGEIDIANLESGTVELRDGSGTTIAEFTSNGDHEFTYQDADGTTDLRVYGHNISADSVRMEYIQLTHEWEARDGTLEVTDNGSYMELSEIASLGTLSVNGTDNAGSSIDFRVERRSDGKTICNVEGIDGYDVDLSSACPEWDPADPDNAYLKFYFDVERDSDADGDTISDWELTYDEQTDVPQIQSKEAVLSGYETDGDEGSSAVGSTDEFTIESVDRDIQEVQWYINGERVKKESVSGSGPFSLEHQWESGGTYFVRADVYSEATGTIGTTSWTINVDEVAINGKSSFVVEPGQSFVLQQTFSANTDEDIEITVVHDGEVVKKIAGPDDTVVSDGRTVSWEFLVEKDNYDGEPMTIIAESGNKKTTKTIQVSTTEQGGFLFVEGDDRNRLVVVGFFSAIGLGALQLFIGIPTILREIWSFASERVGGAVGTIGGVFR